MTDSMQQSDKHDKGSVTGWLKDLLKDISPFIDNASEEQKQRLLSVLEDLRKTDRRKHPRKPCSISITCTVQDRDFTDIVTNISPGGVFIQTSEALSVGQQVTLAFSSPDQEEPINATGKIVWDSPNGIGVKFTSASNNLKEVIKGL